MLRIKTILSGIPASQGVVTGIAQLVLPGQDFSSFRESQILVTIITDPTMISVMIKAKAIVTDLGGITSHPAILSREMGVPCVVNTKKATKIIKTGQLIKVDGKKGQVYILG